MTLLRSRSRWLNSAAHDKAAAVLSLALMAAAQSAFSQSAAADAGWRDVSLAEYRQHLQTLEGVVADCREQFKLKDKTPVNDDACDANRVGPDDRVNGAISGDAQPREVRYDWLRLALLRAGKKDGTAAQPTAMRLGPKAANSVPTVDAALSEAYKRLQIDEAQTAEPTAMGASYENERKALNAILSQKAYKDVSQISAMDRFHEWLDYQLDKFLVSLARFGSRSPWIGWMLLALILMGTCVVLVWAIVRIERSARVRLIPDGDPASGAPSAREWHLWLKDAQAMAAKGEWRNAIHFVYWASIARLESRRVWPADRARTPREYLRLVPGADPHKPTLTALTRDFERTWYGGREAASGDFNAALELAAALGVKTE
jgi:hypothetical protein